VQKHPRKHPRLLIAIPVEIRSEKLIQGSARDISEGGVRVRLEQSVKMDDRVGVTLRLPGFANSDLNFSGEVRWVRREAFGAGCDAGLEFDHTPETRKKLQLMLWELQSGNLGEIERRHRTRRAERKGPETP
jgi:hypothetical protein